MESKKTLTARRSKSNRKTHSKKGEKTLKKASREHRPPSRPVLDSLRCVPTQTRAQKTVEHILEIAAELLSEVGLHGFNTNLLAERAGVKVPTVYRYFPNKLAVLEELSRRMVAEWDSWLDEDLIADPSNDWRAVWTGYIDTFVAGVTAAPAGLAIRSALHSLPELREIEAVNTRGFADRLARALLRRDPSLRRRRIAVAADVLLSTAIAVFDQALSGPANMRSSHISELKAMQIAYLAMLLE